MKNLVGTIGSVLCIGVNIPVAVRNSHILASREYPGADVILTLGLSLSIVAVVLCSINILWDLWEA